MAEEETTADENEFNIARRTRSHLKIDDCGLNVDNLDFPDVERDLYHNPDSEGDPEYRNFLYECYRSAEIRDDTNTDDNDPAYVYNDDIFCPGWTFNLDEELRSQSELDDYNKPGNSQQAGPSNDDNQYHELLSVPNADPQLASTTVGTQRRADGFKSPFKVHRRGVDMFNNPEFTRILNQQLRQHIQLLTQTYLLTKNTTNMRDEADQAKGHLNSYMKIFKNKSKPSNLLPALELVNNLPTPKDIKSSIRLSWRPLPIPESVRLIIKSNPNIFIYPSLLPQVAFSFLPEKLIPKKPKINFTLNEDKLLTYALHEFKGESSQYAFIASLLMTAKTKTQISNHIKNIKRSPGNERNPIKLYYQNGQLPEIDLDGHSDLRDITIVDISTCSENADDVEQPSESKTDILTTSFESTDQKQGENQEEKQSSDELRPGEEGNINNTTSTEPTSEPEPVHGDFHDEEQQQPEQSPPMAVTESADQPQEVQQEEFEQQQQHVVEMDEPLNVIGDGIDNDDNPPVEATPTVHQEERSPFSIFKDRDELMNMDLDDLMAASSTISKTATTTTFHANNNHTPNGHSNNNNNNNNMSDNNNKKNLKLKNSMLNIMSHKFALTQDMGDLMIYEFLRQAQATLSECHHLHLLELLADLMRQEVRGAGDGVEEKVVTTYKEISKFLGKIQAPVELQERVVLFLNLDQATKCGCALSYLHWMRFFEFIQHVELYHDDDGFEKKLARLIDALQRDDPHKVRLATAHLVNKHPELKREFESLSLEAKPDPSLFSCEAHFDDITEPMSMFTDDNQPLSEANSSEIYQFEHFNSKVTKEELSYASQSCPCKCHHANGGQHGSSPIGQHCGKCNLKFMKGRMYIVNKIKPILAEWSYATSPPPSSGASLESSPNKSSANTSGSAVVAASNELPQPARDHQRNQQPPIEWTFEEDKEILEFCRAKAEQNDETVSFDSNTFEELVSHNKRRHLADNIQFPGEGRQQVAAAPTNGYKKSARQIAERFNQLMEMYKLDKSSG